MAIRRKLSAQVGLLDAHTGTPCSQSERLSLSPTAGPDEGFGEPDAVVDTAALKATRLVSMITHEIDLEIRLKHKEIQLVNEELHKCEAQLLNLRRYYDTPADERPVTEPAYLTVQYATFINDMLFKAKQPTPPVLHFAPRSTSTLSAPKGSEDGYRTRLLTSSLRPSGRAVDECIYRRSDGIMVKLTCGNCHRGDFSSVQGFIKHCRIAHDKEFSSQDEAALQRGEILPPDEQDEQGLLALEAMTLQGIDPTHNLLGPGPEGVVAGGEENKRRKTMGDTTKRSVSHLKDRLPPGDLAAFEALVTNVQTLVEKPHLFEDEDETEAGPEIKTEEKPHPPKRRKSRGGMGFSRLSHLKGDSRASKTNTRLSTGHSTSSLTHPSQPPLPKLKLRLESPPGESSRRPLRGKDEEAKEPHAPVVKHSHLRTRSRSGIKSNPPPE